MKAAIVWSLLLLAGSASCIPVEVKRPDWFPDLSGLEKPDWWPDSLPDWCPEFDWERPDWWPDSIPSRSKWLPDWGDIAWPEINWPQIDWDAIPRPVINRGVRGTPATIEEFPGIVQVEIGFGLVWSQGCAGIVLTSVHILSAARCFSGRFYSDRFRRVRAGSSSRYVGGVTVDVASAVTPPSYGDTVENFFTADVAVVRLGAFLTFGPTIQQSPIVASGFNMPGGLPVKLVGWGSTAQGRKISNRRLFSIDLESVENSACSEVWDRLIPIGSIIKVSSDNVCAARPETGGRDTDFRDIGAPIYYENIVVGILSWGNPLGNQRFPLVATGVSSYTDWIVENAV